ncbi:hypothetical protein GCM10007916_30460 [Psychromonas marina]|uniref:Uncharacterized protein n=1 Tax=Psychromonas marina TaxID=88364 RepID=A0ABQ6E3M8_9GAMM|nr:hypothetical protein [Psychromonas marina]GLS91976.1 hypothetical protein GCM10007916_30460 [Psychromonas marina]
MGWLGDFFDDITGESDRRRARHKLQTRVDAAETRKRAVREAHAIWLQRNRAKRAELHTETKSYIKLAIALEQLKSGLTNEPSTVLDKTDFQLIRNHHFKTTFSEARITKHAKKEFHYDNGVFYEGEEDAFIKELDSFMRSELRHTRKLVLRWNKVYKSVKEVYI